MVKKLFALASVTALTGLIATVGVAGCSSTTVQDTAGDCRGRHGATAARSTPKKDGAADEDSGDRPATGTCPSLDPIDAHGPPLEVARRSSTGACTEKELSDLVTYVDANSTREVRRLEEDGHAARPAAPASSARRPTRPGSPSSRTRKGQLVGLNVGGCIAIASGNEKCGQSYQNWFDCRFEACTDCPNGDTAALQKCLSAASKGACKTAFDASAPSAVTR